jgi:prepilin-type N-terminal cleavage/methylation domain-containing protein
MASRRAHQGFSLVEMMVALIAGLLVIGAAVVFMYSSMKSNKDFVGTTRLTQELRNNMDFINREMRRAGYDEDSMTYVALPAASTDRSPFAPITVVNPNSADGCVIYAYDRAGPDRGVGVLETARGERLALRRVLRNVDGVDVGVLEFDDSSVSNTKPDCSANGPDYSTYPPTCNTNTGWCSLSDPKRVNITSFNIVLAQPNQDPTGSGFGTTVRDLTFSVAGTLAQDSTLSQTITSSVRVRAECLHVNAGTTECTTQTP